MCRRAGRPIRRTAAKLDGRVYETAAPAVWFLGVDSKGVATTGDVCEWRAPIRVKPDVMRVSGGYKIALAAIPRAAVIRATFDGSDPKTGPEVPHGEIDAPKGATRLRVVAEVDGQFSQEETALARDRHGRRRWPAAHAAQGRAEARCAGDMTSRFEPKDTAAAFAALDRLAKIPGAKVLGGIDRSERRAVGGGFSDAAPRPRRAGSGRDPRRRGSRNLVETAGRAGAHGEIAARRHCLSVRARPDGFCDASGEDFDRVEWKQD